MMRTVHVALKSTTNTHVEPGTHCARSRSTNGKGHSNTSKPWHTEGYSDAKSTSQGLDER